MKKLKKLGVFIFTLCIVSGSGLHVNADQTEKLTETGSEQSQEFAIAEPALEYSFSEPIITKGKGKTTYTTTLTIEQIDSLEGYQIQILADNEEQIIIRDKLKGSVTPVVFRDGKVNMAVMVGEGVSGKVEVCEITAQYPFSDKNHNRIIKIEELQIVKQVATEEIITQGPWTLTLPYIEPPFYTQASFYILLAIILAILIAGTIWYLRRKKQKK